MSRWRLAWPFAAVVALAVAGAALAQPVPPADVGSSGRVQQQPPQRRGFFEMLFGPSLIRPFQGGIFAPPPAPPPPVQPPQPSEPPLSIANIVPKDADAKKIMVIGDFEADGIAWGLDQNFASEPKVAILDEANNNSGLVRDDFYDWNAELPKLLNSEKPDIVVVALGANDRQQLKLGNARVPPHTDTWEQTYNQRIKGLTDTLKVYGRPFFWVGAPPMRLSAAGRDMSYLNAFFNSAVSEAGGYFVDIWNGFTADDGSYISSGPDVDGQLRALRSGDGINFTRAGRLKLAFYVAREIKRQTGLGAGTVDLLTSANQQNQIEIGPDGKKRLVGPIISLTDPVPIGGQLAGAAQTTVTKESDMPGYVMIVKGEALPTVAGRADDFTWPAAAGGTTPAPAGN
ncbi:MAG TPA: SGNH family hydrolase [Bauldia sp.]|nr:SGNH family hydrolase [Bauldia sp.]